MQKKNILICLLVVLQTLGLAVLLNRCVRLQERVAELERAREHERVSAAKPVVSNATGAVSSPVPTVTPQMADDLPEVPDEPPQMKVVDVRYDEETKLDVTLSERPDMEVVRHYVTVEPMAEGRPVFEYDATYNHARRRYEPHLKITGEFAFRTNVTLRIRKGLPMHGKGRDPGAEGALKEDFAQTFVRKDRQPYVAFAADGRYLPSGGRRAVEIESMNVTNVCTEIRRVEPRNVVQMLAREEGAYRRHWWRRTADDEETEELSGAAASNVFFCINRANVKEIHPLGVTVGDGRRTNGIYLVAVRNGDRPLCRNRWDDDLEYNPFVYRVVCLSDLGLSVRKSGQDELGVWVTSLLRGTPVGGAWVEVYSSANVKVMEGRTDGRGWCRATRIERGEPFAVVVIAPDGDDMTFMALRESMGVDETYADGARADYLSDGEADAFLWTDRGIYRHGERIFLQAILRDCNRRAPKPMPVEFVLTNPNGDAFARETALTDAEGAVTLEKFSVPAEQPSGVWTLEAKVPGKDGKTLGQRSVKIEEFAPPQIRVKVEADAVQPSNFAFKVSAEHLFGGPANGLRCEGAVVFEDVAFAPADWKGWQFGNEDRGLKPSYRKVGEGVLGRTGSFRFDAPLWADTGLPKSAVRVTGQGVVFEDGGRPATMRQSSVLHYYPFYIGSTLPGWVKLEPGRRPSAELVCVDLNGRALAEPKELTAKVERIDSVYSYRKSENGWNTWNCEHVRATVADGLKVVTGADGRAKLELPLSDSGDYAVTVTDEKTHASFAKSFYLSSWGDDVVRAPLDNPTAVTLQPNKAFYRVGEAPRLTVKAPFAGAALLTVLREKEVYTEVLDLTNATSEVVLHPVRAGDAPNLDVYVSVVQSVGANARHLAVRAHGQVTVPVRPLENEIPVSVAAELTGLTNVAVSVDAPGAACVTVTVVDEAINLLTGEKTPDPIGHFAKPRGAEHQLYDLYHRILPVVGEDALHVSGVKTGGGFGAEMLGRVSPTPTRRFRPLALWTGKVALADGKGRVSLRLPEFVGEVRVTAVACSARATGAASVQKKVTPKLVMMPDAPRFVAPGDVFEMSMPVHNRNDGEATFDFEITCAGKALAQTSGVRLPKDGFTNVTVRAAALSEPGEMDLVFRLRGLGETHEQSILLPVRPAVAWEETAGVERMKGEEFGAGSEELKRKRGWTAYRVYDSPVGELAKAMEWLADYPHGCLEQTASRIFPLVTAGGILASVGSAKAKARPDYVLAGVRRVESMIRENDFVMWPDCDYAPWDRGVSLYAAHFLIEAERAGQPLTSAARTRVTDLLQKWALSTNETVSAYALHTLVLAKMPEKDRMLLLYDRLDSLSLLDRARLARAFVALGDRTRAETLLRNATSPDSVKEAAFVVLALLEIDPDDARILPLVKYLVDRRDRQRFHWGTTEENAHALLALGEYYLRHPPEKGEKFVFWRKLSLPDVTTVTNESHGLSVTRRFLTSEGVPADMSALRRGELLIAELTVTTDTSRWLSDLVVEDLFVGAFEPVHGGFIPFFTPATNEVKSGTWVMRSDARDDRMVVFSKRFRLEKDQKAVFRHPLRVVSAGDYVLPGPSVEAMYFPALRAKAAPTRIAVER